MQRRCCAVILAVCFALVVITTALSEQAKSAGPPKEIVEANNRFALKLLKQAFKATPDKNIIISPLSLSYSFGLLQNGAAPAARKEIVEVFEFGSLTPQQVNVGMRDLRKSLTHDWKWEGETFKPFRLSTSLWIRGREAYRPGFLNVNRHFYGAQLKTLPGNPTSATAAINSYVRQDSGGKIDKVVSSMLDDQFVLMTATHMVCGWGHEVFLPVYVKEGGDKLPFHGVGGEKPIPMMYSTHRFQYGKWNDMEAVKAGCLTVFLPDRESTLAKTIDELTPGTWTQWTASLPSPDQVMLVLPKLTIASDTDSKTALQGLGLKLPFSSFSGLGRTLTNPAGAKLTRILQSSFLRMDEYGLELGSVTYAGGIPGGLEGASRPRLVVVDRPFAFVVTDTNGTIMYVGTVVDPDYRDRLPEH